MLVGAGLKTIGRPFSALSVVIAAGTATVKVPTCRTPSGLRIMVSPWIVTVAVDVGLSVMIVPFIDSSAAAGEDGLEEAVGVDEIDWSIPESDSDDEDCDVGDAVPVSDHVLCTMLSLPVGESKLVEDDMLPEETDKLVD